MAFIFKDIKQATIAKPLSKPTVETKNYQVAYQLEHFNKSKFTKYETPKFDPNTVEYVNLTTSAVKQAVKPDVKKGISKEDSINA